MQKGAKRLGRGLNSLLSATQTPVDVVSEAPPAGGAAMIEVGSIRPNPYQPRQELKAADMEALVFPAFRRGRDASSTEARELTSPAAAEASAPRFNINFEI